MEQEIRAFLPADYPWTDRFHYFDTIDSTNNYLKKLAAEGAPHGTVAVANCQTGGKGRLGRSFQSPPGLGLYLSVLWRTGLRTDTLPMVTPLAAVAVCRAIEEICGLHCGIKWPNDLLLGGKKVCGILTESAFRPDGTPDWVVVGMNAVVSIGAEVGEWSIVAEGAVVKQNGVIEPGKVVTGAPAKPVRDTLARDKEWWTASKKVYEELAARYLAGGMKPVEEP